MTIYTVIRKSDQVEVTRYASMQVAMTNQYPLLDYDHNEIDPEAEAQAQASPVRITKLAFRNRFTQAEKVAIEIAALDVPTAPMPQRAQAAALRASQQDVMVAQHIDLTRPDTRAGVQMLEAAGLLAAGRAAVILDTPPTDTEVWNG